MRSLPQSHHHSYSPSLADGRQIYVPSWFASSSTTLSVELDAVVLDKNDRPVHGLQQRDFQIKDDGVRVELTGFREVSPAGISGRDDEGSVVLLLDDNAVPLNARPSSRTSRSCSCRSAEHSTASPSSVSRIGRTRRPAVFRPRSNALTSIEPDR